MQDVVHFEIMILSGVVHFEVVTLLQGVVHFKIMTLLLGVVHFGIVTLPVHGGPRSGWVRRYHDEWDGLQLRVRLLRNDTVGVPSAFGQHLGFVSVTQRQTDHPIV